MKKILFIFILLFPLKSYSQILYCVEDASVGFKDSLKITKFNVERFTVEIDLQNKKIYSEELIFPKELKNKTHCFYDSRDFHLTCSNIYYQVFVINLKSYQFIRAGVAAGLNDSNYISKGKCEKF